MKALVCEMCGSHEVVKVDGLFVCQSCGTKYSVEDAKKMMIEGNVDVTGSTVKIDSTDELQNLYQLARRAKDENNSENAAKYYDMILVKEPQNWEAAFYSVYFKASDCMVGKIGSSAQSVNKCLNNVFELIKNNVSDKNEQIEIVKEIDSKCKSISYDMFKAIKLMSQKMGVNYNATALNDSIAVRNIMLFLGDNIKKYFGDYSELNQIMIGAWKEGVDYHNNMLQFVSLIERDSYKKIIMGTVRKIQEYEPSYYSQTTVKNKSGGCYIATAVYGSYDCPEVWVLRRFRDYTLAEKWYGRLFIKVYYAISPSLVKLFGNTKWFKMIWRKRLDPMVAKLKNKGVKETPYIDRKWR